MLMDLALIIQWKELFEYDLNVIMGNKVCKIPIECLSNHLFGILQSNKEFSAKRISFKDTYKDFLIVVIGIGKYQ